MYRSVVDRRRAVSYLHRRGTPLLLWYTTTRGRGGLTVPTARSAEEPSQRILVHNFYCLYVALRLPSCLHISLIYTVFEIVSAYSTVGLSLGVPSVKSHFVILPGRVSPFLNLYCLTFFIADATWNTKISKTTRSPAR